ncbi:MAG TPA: AAA domain-containing protein [Longimicrobium sp.]
MTQYRMHPEIGELVSRVFYDGALLHGVSPADRWWSATTVSEVRARDSATHRSEAASGLPRWAAALLRPSVE